jgi:hypothetical protein
MLSPSEKLGVFGPWRWLVDMPPWLAFVVMLVITPISIKYVMRPIWEGRILRRRDEFVTFQCDVFFAPALAAGLVLVNRLEDRVYLSGNNPIHWVFLLLGVVLGVGHYLQERKFYSWRQMLTITKIFHELLFPFVGYMLLVVGVYGLIFAPWTFDLIVVRLVFLVSVAIWAVAWPIFDEKHKHDLDEDGHDRYWYAHPQQGHPWQHKYRELPAYWARYVADWRDVPRRVRELIR